MEKVDIFINCYIMFVIYSIKNESLRMFMLFIGLHNFDFSDRTHLMYGEMGSEA